MSDPGLKQSIKRHDMASIREAAKSGGVYYLIFPDSYVQTGDLPRTLPERLPAEWQRCDRVLRNTLDAEGFWGSAVKIKIDELVGLGYEIRGDVPRRVAQAYQVLRRVPFFPNLKKGLEDYYSTDNGLVFEVIHQTGAPGSKVIAVDHLDTVYCQRTGDPERPIIYEGLDSKRRELRWWQVLTVANMPRSGREFHGRGRCAAHRVYERIRQLAWTERAIMEAVEGKRIRRIYIIGGMSGTAFESGLSEADAAAEGSGTISYRGAAIMPVATTDPMTLLTIDLAGLPEWAKRMEEWEITATRYARALGLDVQKLTPLKGQGLGSGKQSEVLAEQSKQDSFPDEFATALADSNAIPPGTTYYMPLTSLNDQLNQAKVAKTRSEDLEIQVRNQILTPQQALQLKVDAGDVPATFLPAPDETPATVLTNEDNPEEGAANDATND